MSLLQPESLLGSRRHEEDTGAADRWDENNNCFLVQADMRKPYLSGRVT